MARERELTYQQLRMLRAVERYGEPTAHLHGMSERGGGAQTLASILRRGLMTETCWPLYGPSLEFGPFRHAVWVYELTDAGRAALTDMRQVR